MSGHRGPGPNALAGIALVIAAVACFATLDTTTKYISVGVPVLMALWFRYLFQAVATAVVVLPARGLSVLRTRHPKFQCLRGVLLLLTSLFAFFSLKYMPVGEFTAIVMITPLVITLLAATQLKERVSPLRWALVVGGFTGTMIIIRPGGDDFNWTLLMPLGLVATIPGVPTAPWLLATAASVDFLSVITLMLAIAGLSIGKDLPMLKEIGWKILPVGFVVIAATFLASTVIAQFVLGFIG